MAETSIQWTDHSINPIRARLKTDLSVSGHYCEKLSAGCANCYASNLQKRFGMPAFLGTSGRGLDVVKPFLDEFKLVEVLRRQKPTKYFWCDMTDMFGSWVPDEWIDLCFATMALTPQHTHQVLTKRADRLTEQVMTAAESVLKTLHHMIGLSVYDAAVPESELIVRCWLADQRRFGLRGYEQQYPDANAVRVVLCDNKPQSLQGRGFIIRTSPLTWALTEDGAYAARKLIGGTVAA